MVDGDVATAWGTEWPQVGGEEVIVELGASAEIGSVVLEMGPYAFGYPSALDIDVSDDSRVWMPTWRGNPGILAVRGALEDPGQAPIALRLEGARGRFIRLRQTGAEPGIPWWIADLSVHGP